MARIRGLDRTRDRGYRLHIEGVERFAMSALLRTDPWWLAEGVGVEDVSEDPAREESLAQALREHVREAAGRTGGALATLAYDTRRGPFFEGQLLAALTIVQSGDTGATAMTGSWAGAMGHTQFIPTSYLAHAVDFTGDGRRDIWSDDPTDALASTAAYLANAGWQTGRPWGVEVTLPPGFDYGETGERVKKPVTDWQALGVRMADGGPLPDHGPASVLLPAGALGAAFLIFANFQVIEKYNTADAYVIAVGHLADRIAGGPPIRAAWPRQDRALKFDERVELQQRLAAAGFDPGAADGKIGPNTIAAVRAFQRSIGAVPDGYASLAMLQKLR